MLLILNGQHETHRGRNGQQNFIIQAYCSVLTGV